MAKRKRSKRFKIALGLMFLVLVGVIILFNKTTVNNLVPFNDPIDPWPIKQECDLPPLKDKTAP